MDWSWYEENIFYNSTGVWKVQISSWKFQRKEREQGGQLTPGVWGQQASSLLDSLQGDQQHQGT